MIISYVLVSLCLALGCGLASRIEGGGPPRLNKLVSQTIVMLPVIAFGFALSAQGGVASLFGYIGRVIGHGQYFLQRGVKALEPERVDFIVRLLFGDDPRAVMMVHLRGVDEGKLDPSDRFLIRTAMEKYGMKKLYARCVFGMALTGLLVTLPLVVCLLASKLFIVGFLVFVAGLSKAAGYVIGYEIERHGLNKHFPEHLRGGTEIAEFTEVVLMVSFLSIAFWGFLHGF